MRCVFLVLAVLASQTLPGAPASAEPAPAFALPALDGRVVRSDDFRGRPLVIDFWATWCEPCKAALAEHEQLVARYGAKVGLVAINLDEQPGVARRFLERRGVAVAVLLDPEGRAAAAFGVTAMPYAVVVGADGAIRERIDGAPYPRLWAAVERGLQRASGCVPVVRTGGAMGTRVSVQVCPGPAGEGPAREAAEVAFAEFGRLEALWSTWIPTSEVSRLNAAAGGEAVAVSDETFAVLRRARAGSEANEGLFDVTFAPLGSLWTFDTPPGRQGPTRLDHVPTVAEVAARRGLVGWRGLALDDTAHTARLERAGMAVHLGGIGKGAGVDRAVALLRARGFRDFCVQAGGDLYCGGRKGDRPWRIGIAHPRQPGALLGALDVSDAAFSTSGDYERYALIDGRRYHHILDPRTGFPAAASQSATVLAPTATDAEVLTKVAFILGGEAGLAAIAKVGARGVLVDAEGAVHVSAGLALEAP